MCIWVYLGVIVESSDNPHPPGRSRGGLLLVNNSELVRLLTRTIVTKHITIYVTLPTFTGLRGCNHPRRDTVHTTIANSRRLRGHARGAWLNWSSSPTHPSPVRSAIEALRVQPVSRRYFRTRCGKQSTSGCSQAPRCRHATASNAHVV